MDGLHESNKHEIIQNSLLLNISDIQYHEARSGQRGLMRSTTTNTYPHETRDDDKYSSLGI